MRPSPLSALIVPTALLFGSPIPALSQPIIQDCTDCPEMVVLDPGAFERLDHPNPWVRDDREERGPAHQVQLGEPFAIGRHEVTVAQFEACVDAGACGHAPEGLDGAGPDDPVVDVNWHEAQEYVEWLSLETGHTYRLPTEAEWEYAARGGQDGKFFASDDPKALCELANTAGEESELDWANDLCVDDYRAMAPVGSFEPNGFGLFDMAGNVWEWVEDCHHDAGWEARGEWSNEYRERTPRDGSAFVGTDAECHSRIMRGGSWRNGGAHVFSPHFRNFDYAIRRYPNLGFRVARELQASRP